MSGHGVSKSIVILTMLLFLSQSVISIESIEADNTLEVRPGGWWDSWIRDKDQDGIDDLLASREFPETVIIDYHRSTTDVDINNLENLGSDIVYRCLYINSIIATVNDPATLRAVSRLPGVIMVEAEVEAKAAMNIAARAAKVRQSDEYSSAWELGYTGVGVNVAVVDSGVDDEHLDFSDKFIAGADFSRVIPREDANPDDNFYHGTHVAGTLMGTGNALQEDGENKYIGIAPGARLVDVKALTDRGSVLSPKLTMAYEWCITNKDTYEIRMISTSVTETSDSDGSGALCDAVNAAVDNGIVFIAAMGNEGLRQVPAPAAADGAIAVGAVNDHDTIIRDDDTWEDYSNWGPRMGGDNITTIEDLKPDVVAPGDFVAPAYNTVDGYERHDGTSMATPIVSGIVALMLEANPFLSVSDIKKILRDSSERRGEAYDGALDPYYDTQHGWGIVDGRAAVEMALETPYPDLDLQIVTVGDTSISLEWNEYKGTGFDEYEIYVYEGDEPGTSPSASSSDRKSTTTRITGLSPGTNYNVMLCLVNWAGIADGIPLAVTTEGEYVPDDNNPPTAFIDTISPKNVEDGELVSFSGYGEDSDGMIIGYSWTSNIDNTLSIEANFTTEELSVGEHTISFKVLDDDNDWSTEVTDIVTVYSDGTEVPDDPPAISITDPTPDQEFNSSVSEYTVTGTASDDIGVSKVNWRVDGGNWKTADGTTSWSFELDIADLGPGDHTIEVKATDTSGQETTDDVDVVVLGESTSGNVMGIITEPTNLLFMSLFVIAIIASLVVRRKKKQRYKPATVYPIE